MFHPSIIFRTASIGVIVGALLFNWWSFYNLSWWWVFLIIVVVIIMSLKLVPRQLFILGLLAATILWWRALYLPITPPADIFVGPREFTAEITAASRAGDKIIRYVVSSPDFQLGKIQLTAKPFPEFYFGQVVRVRCKNVTEITADYYRLKNIYRECAFPDLSFLSDGKWSLKRTLLQARDLDGVTIKSNLAEPYASLLTGMLWGDDAGLPKDLLQNFRTTGTSHILAVSGFNVMVLSQILFYLFLGIGLWRRQASIVVISLIALFVVFTGGEPAVLRAGIMASLIKFGHLVGRKSEPWNILLGAAATMLLFDPRLILDLGFELSFAAMIGLTVLAPKLENIFKKLPDLINLKEIFLQTVSATLVTLPIILLRLDQVSLVSVVVNLLVGPVVATVFILGLITTVVATWPLLGAMAIWLSTLALAYIVMIVEWFGSLPNAQVGGSIWVWLIVIIIYIIGGKLVVKKSEIKE